MPAPHVLGHLEFLWRVGYSLGSPLIGDSTDVEIAAEWTGRPNALTQALLQTTLIDEIDDGQYEIHDLLENAPDYVRKRFNRRHVRRTADSDRRTADSGGQVRPTDQDSTRQDSTKKLLSTEVCSEPLGTTASEPTATTDDSLKTDQDRRGKVPDQAATQDRGDDALDQAVISFPIVGGKRGKGPAEWPLRQSKIAEYAESFPGVEVLAECRKAMQWCRDNPTRRKTFRGMAAFLQRWLGKAQDSCSNGKAIPRYAGKEFSQDRQASEQRRAEAIRRIEERNREEAQRRKREAEQSTPPTPEQLQEIRHRAREVIR